MKVLSFELTIKIIVGIIYVLTLTFYFNFLLEPGNRHASLQSDGRIKQRRGTCKATAPSHWAVCSWA